jgi:AraC family transcriptional regulator
MASASLITSAYDPNERHSRHSHDYTSVSVVLSGSLVERVGSIDVEAGPLAVVVKPAGTEHADAFGPRGAVLVRFQVAPEWLTPLDDGSPVIAEWRWGNSPAVARWLLRLAEADRSAGMDEDAVAECLGAIDQDRRGGQTALAGPGTGVPPWLCRLRERILDERNASVAMLAREVGMHPVYITRCFRRAFGMSISQFKRAVRVRAVAGRLAAGAETLATVASEAGFADQSHLTREFRRVTGVTPATYRRLLRRAEV